jgi:hypothetical protein
MQTEITAPCVWSQNKTQNDSPAFSTSGIHTPTKMNIEMFCSDNDMDDGVYRNAVSGPPHGKTRTFTALRTKFILSHLAPWKVVIMAIKSSIQRIDL